MLRKWTPTTENNVTEARIELLKAVGNGNLEALKIYYKTIEENFNWLAKDDGGLDKTPLMMASKKGKLGLAQFLVERGAELDTSNEESITAIFYAAQDGHLEVLQFLAENGAVKDKADNDGASPVLIAAQEGHLRVVQYLVERGAARTKPRTMAVVVYTSQLGTAT